MKDRTNKKVFQSRDVNLEGMVSEPTPATKGPATGGELVQSPGQWLERNATPEELATFRGSVQARLERIAAVGMIELPGGMKIKGDSVLTTCSNCRRWAWTSPGHETDACLLCNSRNLKGGGFMRAASKGEIKSWFAREKAAHAKYLAGAPQRAKDLAEFNKRHFEDVGKDDR